MKSNRPLVSVILAVKDGEKTLHKVLDSLLNQTYSNLEIVVVNDGSKDKTASILERYERKDSRVKVITNKRNLGKCKSRNKAIKESTGKYIAVNDADDISYPHRIERELEYLANNQKVYLVGSRANILDEQGKRIGISWGKKEPANISGLLLQRNVLVHSSVMFRNEQEFFYREKFPRAQDYDLYLQMVAHRKRIHILPNILVGYSTKKDIEYGEYLIDQIVFSYTMQKLAKQYLKTGKDMYEKITKEYMYEIFPKDELAMLYFLQSYTQEDFRKAQKEMIVIIKTYGINIQRVIYLIDAYLGGGIFRLGKKLKRYIRNIFNV